MMLSSDQEKEQCSCDQEQGHRVRGEVGFVEVGVGGSSLA